MRLSRPAIGVVALALGFALLALILERIVPLAATIGLFGWLLATQYRFYVRLQDWQDNLTVTYAAERRQVLTEEPLQVQIDVDQSSTFPLRVALRIDSFVGEVEEATGIRLPIGEQSATEHVTINFPVAGRFSLGKLTATITDESGLFSESLPVDVEPPVVQVDPRAPTNMHIGEGGDQIAAEFGEHPAGRLGTGLTPAEVREYVPGDSARRIDWKATARLDHPHIREFEAETDRRTLLFIDHRSRMGAGRRGETKLDFSREIGLAFLQSARELDDPLGLVTVGDHGLTTKITPDADPVTYVGIRDELVNLSPTQQLGSQHQPNRISPSTARQHANNLNDLEKPFASTLRPYFDAADPYMSRLQGDPLYESIRTTLKRQRGSIWSVVITDDTDRTTVTEAVKLARRGGNHVLVFLLPSALFTADSISQVENVYEEYVDFEAFRRNLARLDRVSAFEVAPGDRLATVLETTRQDRRFAEP